MEIEFSQSNSKKRIRDSFELSNILTIESFKTPNKLSKRSSQSFSNPLTNTEKSIAYLQSKLGTKPAKIAIKLGRYQKTVKGFLNNATSKQTLMPRHSEKGRWKKGDTKLTERHKNLLKSWLQAGTMNSVRQCWLKLNKVKSVSKVSYHPVRKFLKSLGSFVRPKLKTVVSPANRTKRLNYCNEKKDFNFRKVLFSDESSFQLNTNNIRAFRIKGKEPPKVTKYNPNHKIMVWAGISYYGKTSLHFIEGKLNQVKYVGVLEAHQEEMQRIFRRRGIWHFQQDNAPCHKPLRVKNFILNNLRAEILPHPPQSPDLNPIELVWAFMKGKVEATRPRNAQQLKNSIIKAWKQVSINLIRKCIDDLPQKMKKIIEFNGNIL